MINLGDKVWVMAHDLSEDSDSHFMANVTVVEIQEANNIRVKFTTNDISRSGQSHTVFGIEGIYKKIKLGE